MKEYQHLIGKIIVAVAIIVAAVSYTHLQDKKRVKNAKDYISEVEKIAKKQVKKNRCV